MLVITVTIYLNLSFILLFQKSPVRCKSNELDIINVIKHWPILQSKCLHERLQTETGYETISLRVQILLLSTLHVGNLIAVVGHENIL